MTRRQPRRGRPVLAVGLITILAIALGFGLGAVYRAFTGAADPSASPPVSSASPSESSVAVTDPPPSASAPASADASDEPDASPVVDAPDGLIPPGSAVTVLVDGLRLRAGPSVDAELLDELPAGRILLVGFQIERNAWGPVAAGGLSWYPVVPIGPIAELPPLSGGPIVAERDLAGWVAAGDDVEPFVELLDARCPAGEPDLAMIEAMLPWERLACFGGRQIALDGTYGCGACDGTFPGSFEPAWLAFPLTLDFLSVDAGERIGPFSLRFPPGGPPAPEVGSIVRVVGHFDDPAGTGCTVSPGEPPAAIDAVAAELTCREQFVVESIEVIGTDPEFPSG